ncbi:PAAR domain-containing protein [Paraburkholderia strydomiana]|uniref:PAAR domain-containing protein n=1 Tax=Paraburkholderia strydomiana TaxID=1245417 RepID=UPI001BE54CC0|nr:PAAR domain-containing protein [Paraburkholderia strydomiana]MBT2789163.1 PAAR domain-containing protein [Paraburkholderia strydomiana]
MRIAVARDRDVTTTGGRVMALKAMIHDNGIKLALDGEHATCGNCKGSWPMHGTGDKMRNRGTPVVLDNDPVLCPCGKNRVIAASDAKCFVHKNTNTGRSTVANPPPGVTQTAPYDEQFTLLDAALRPLADMRYRIVVDGEPVITGTTNASGQTERVTTRSASNLKLQLDK